MVEGRIGHLIPPPRARSSRVAGKSHRRQRASAAFALSYLLWLGARGQSAFQLAGTGQSLLLVCSGPLSAVPLTLFAAGARRLPLSLVGLLQYVSPSLQLLLGVYLWHEPFNGVRLIGYALIWLALIIYSVESLWTARQLRRPGGVAT